MTADIKTISVPRDVFDAMIERLQFCLDTFGPIQDRGSEAADLDDWRALIQPTPAETEGEPFAWYWEATDGQSAWPVWSMQSERPKHAPDRAVPVYLRSTPPPRDGEGDLVARLRGELVQVGSQWEQDPLCREAATAIESLSRQLEEAREALRPFADLGEVVLAEAPPDAVAAWSFTSSSEEAHSISLDAFRSALEASK